MKITKRDRNALIILSFILILALYVLLFWWPGQSEYTQKKAERDNAARELQTLREASAALEIQRKNVEDLLAQTRQEFSALPEAADRAELLLIFRELAERHGLQELSEQYDNAVEDSAICIQPVRLSFMGSYAALEGFLTSLQDLEIINRVTALEISSAEGTFWQVHMTAEFGYSTALTEPQE